jgi:hypothetical protein
MLNRMFLMLAVCISCMCNNPASVDNRIVGSWTYTIISSKGVVEVNGLITYNKDGTYAECWNQNGEKGSTFGTYSTSGDILTVEWLKRRMVFIGDSMYLVNPNYDAEKEGYKRAVSPECP